MLFCCCVRSGMVSGVFDLSQLKKTITSNIDVFKSTTAWFFFAAAAWNKSDQNQFCWEFLLSVEQLFQLLYLKDLVLFLAFSCLVTSNTWYSCGSESLAVIICKFLTFVRCETIWIRYFGGKNWCWNYQLPTFDNNVIRFLFLRTSNVNKHLNKWNFQLNNNYSCLKYIHQKWYSVLRILLCIPKEVTLNWKYVYLWV